ncbi:MAG: DUF1425 domain-containing protein [Planctomycetota bacterium]
MTKLVSNLLCSALLVAALAGCKSYAANTVVVRPEVPATLNVVNGGLQSEAQLLPDQSQALYEGDILVGSVAVKNNVDGRVMYEYRWKWADSDVIENEVGGGGETWRTLWINPLETVQVQGRATTPGATEGELYLRYAMDATQ